MGVAAMTATQRLLQALRPPRPRQGAQGRVDPLLSRLRPRAGPQVPGQTRLTELEIEDRTIADLAGGLRGLPLITTSTSATPRRPTAGRRRWRWATSWPIRSSIVVSYQGDGDLASIGLAEILHAAQLGIPISVIFINNGDLRDDRRPDGADDARWAQTIDDDSRWAAAAMEGAADEGLRDDRLSWTARPTSSGLRALRPEAAASGLPEGDQARR